MKYEVVGICGLLTYFMAARLSIPQPRAILKISLLALSLLALLMN
jgi:hypothetical protein